MKNIHSKRADDGADDDVADERDVDKREEICVWRRAYVCTLECY